MGEQKQLKEDLEMKQKEGRNVLKKRERHLEARLGKAAVGYITALEEAHIQSPTSSEHDLRESANMITLRILRWGKDPALSGGPQM